MSALRTRAPFAAFALSMALGCGPRVGSGASETPASDQTSSTSEAPGDELTQICEHNYAVLVERVGAGSPAVHDSFVANCKTNSAARREALDAGQWAERKRCILAAEDADALGICDGRKPKPKPEPEARAEGETSIGVVCDHIMKIIERELGSPSTPIWTEEERNNMVKNCVEEGTRERSQDPAGFERQASCILQATGIEAFERCED